MDAVAARDAGQLADRLLLECYGYEAFISAASDPGSTLARPKLLPGHQVPVGTVERLDGSSHAYDFSEFLRRATLDGAVVMEARRVWYGGAVLMLGDALTAGHYFDHAPELEFVRHLRNAVGHGNRFRFSKCEPARPAHTRLTQAHFGKSSSLEITRDLEGRVALFDFIERADVLDVLQSVALYLIRLGNGDTPVRHWVR